MVDLDSWREIFQNLHKNKLRTVLSGFTVAFGIMLFTILFGIGNGLKNTFTKSFAGTAQNVITIRRGITTKPYKGLQSGRKIELKNEDYDFILSKFKDKVQYISPSISQTAVTSYHNEKNEYYLYGVYPDYRFFKEMEMDRGRFINRFDVMQKTKNVVIGNLISRELFGGKKAIGKTININEIPYTVVGVFSFEGNEEEERLIFTPLSTLQLIYKNTDKVDRITLTYNPKLDLDEAITFGNNLLKSLKEKLSVHPRDTGAVRVENLAEANKSVGSFMNVLNIIIIFIGLGTLIAGIIGISNIMVYIVRERTKELGIRKAIGATPRNIISMIMMESILITAIAGYVGLLLGTGILKLMAPTLETYFITNPSVNTSVVVGATIVLVLAGVLAGYLPAKRASKIKPIEALNDK
ncbi:MAG: ABC transporter permease [Flavobacteriaceae bacterium]|nr:ABC transporter permease [Flavobacteriaceae bacterium]